MVLTRNQRVRLALALMDYAYFTPKHLALLTDEEILELAQNIYNQIENGTLSPLQNIEEEKFAEVFEKAIKA